MSDLDDVLTGIMLTLERSREMLSLWEVDESALGDNAPRHTAHKGDSDKGDKSAKLLYASPMLKLDEDFSELEARSAEDISAIFSKVSGRSFLQPQATLAGQFGDLYIDSLHPVEGSYYCLVKFDRIPFPFELSHKPRSQKVSDLERKITRNITHELLTPLNSIQGLNEQLSEAILDESMQEALNLNVESCAMVKTHISDIVNYVSLSATETQAYTVEHFDVLETLYSISSKANRTILENDRDLNFSLRYPIDKESIAVKGYPGLLEQALLHLIDNAIKFTPDGGKVTVEFSVENEHKLCFSVADTGCGIGASDQRIIFRPFILGDMADTRTRRGIGLGLASALECLVIMSGNENAKFDLQSSPGQGARFAFSLPYEPSSTRSSASVKGLELPKAPDQYHILVAEDNPTQQLIVDRLIKKLGFKSTVVENGVEALGEYVRADTNYDLILMDIQMPGISGHEATRMIRKHESEFNLEAIPIVAITANIEKEVHSESLRCGMNGHYGKPVTRVVLDELIRKSLLGICQ